MKTLAIASFALLAGGTVAAAATLQQEGSAESRLERALAGRTAEAPRACLQPRDIRGNTPIDENTILFEGNGGLVYLNRTRDACAGLRSWDALRSRRIGASLCEGDLVVAFDPTSGVERGGCTLGQFVPYRRTAQN